MAYLYYSRDYQKRDLQFFSKVQPHFSNLRDLEDPRPIMKRFANFPLFKKQADNLRIIIEEVLVSQGGQVHQVYCVRRVFPRGDKEYETNFSCNQFIQRWHKQHPISEEERAEIGQWLAEELARERKSDQLPELPDHLKKWFKTQDLFLSNATIYEMQEWTETIRIPEIYKFKETICAGIFEIQEEPDKHEVVWRSPGARNIFLVRLERGLHLLCERVQIPEEGPMLVLYQIFRLSRTDLEAMLAEAEKTISRYQHDGLPDKEFLLRDAKRAYPDYILADAELWFLIQEDSVANLALSPEEEKLLQEATFPLFVNGQAGSGKSTMLFYLFAQFCSIYQKGDPPPLFLTYNERLLNTARENVLAILNRHPSFAEKRGPDGTGLASDAEISQCFSPFQAFIKTHLIPLEALDRFEEENKMTFSKFKTCFLGEHEDVALNCKLPNTRHFSPELVWHIIRTYIKGYNPKGTFTVADYRQLDRDDFSVSVEKFEEVYGTIWEKWYQRLCKDRFWDDQDLIRFALEKGNIDPSYSVIVCDEAQDFTRIEIELLLRLSVCTQYNLAHHSNIPFSFAGDPYQTINPTGFRWASLKNIFNERFEKLNPKGLSIRFEPLSQNYRSKPALIQFTNLIQGFRYVYLKIKELRPQSAWQKMEGVSPVLIVTDDSSVAKLAQHAVNTMTIVPIDDGLNQEKAFVRQDPILSRYIEIPSEEQESIRNVISASSSKGSEFDKVIVYNFGEFVPPSFAKAVANRSLSDNEFIELAHFFNKLYVAVSRARDRLFVLDTPEGHARFWSHFESLDLMEEEVANQRYWKEQDLRPLLRGDESNYREMDGDPLENARQFEKIGLDRGSSDDLGRARQFYMEAKYSDDALRCQAWAAWYREEWEHAGICFEAYAEKVEPEFALESRAKAAKAYWRGEVWERYRDLHPPASLDRQLAEFMLGELSVEVLFGQEAFIDRCSPRRVGWKNVVRKIRAALIRVPDHQLTAYANFAQQIGSKGFKTFYDYAADLYYRDQSYEQAIRCWDRNQYQEHPNYYRSQLQMVVSIPEKILWYNKLKEDAALVELYDLLEHQRAGGKPTELSSEVASMLIGALLRQEAFSRAIDFPYLDLKTKTRRLVESLSTLNEEKDKQLLNHRKQIVFNFLLNQGKEGINALRRNLRTFENFFHNKDAIRLILGQENWEDLLNDLDKELRTGIPGKFIESFVEIVCEEIRKGEIARVPRAIDLIGELNRRHDKLTENVKLIRAIAYSEVTPDSFPPKLRGRLEGFVRKCIWEQNGWQKDLNFQEIGTAMERLGAKSITLQNEIYEYVIQYEPEFEAWAKRRWIKVAERRADYERQQKRSFPARKIEADIAEKIRLWELDQEVLQQEPTFPLLIDRDSAVFSFRNLTLAGFEGEPTVDSRRNRVLLELQDHEIRINCKTQLVFIEEFDTSKTVDIDVRQKKIGGLGVEMNNGEDSYHLDGGIQIAFTKESGVEVGIGETRLTIALEPVGD